MSTHREWLAELAQVDIKRYAMNGSLVDKLNWWSVGLTPKQAVRQAIKEKKRSKAIKVF